MLPPEPEEYTAFTALVPSCIFIEGAPVTVTSSLNVAVNMRISVSANVAGNAFAPPVSSVALTATVASA